jgi:type I restriction enzyme M protein
MTKTEELQKRTTVNIQEKANLIWAIADKLVGTYKPHEYGNVVLPMCVIKRFSDTLAPTKQAVLDAYELYAVKRKLAVYDGFLREAAGFDFYNISRFTFDGLLADADNIADNFRSYLNHFSKNVIDIIEKFDFDKEISKMEHNGILYNVISEFCSKKAYMGADAISAVDMGYIFEELVRKFSESYDEQAGAHFTARDIIYLMAELLIAEQSDTLRKQGVTASIYDMAMGTSQMLDCLGEKLREIDPDAQLTEFGQELNEQTFAIAKSNLLIKGGQAENMQHGNTLSDDKFDGYCFDYIISNPPFGIEWKNEKPAVEAEHRRGPAGRFAAGLPAIGDSQQLFMLNGVAKLKDNGRMAIIQNGSPLFKGDAGSGESEIRGYLLENDWLEAIVQIPNDMFYNTGIATYIWIVTKNKSAQRVGKVQLIDASHCSHKRRKPIGNKRNEFTDDCITLVKKAYLAFTNGVFTDGDLQVEVKIKDNDDFKFRKVTVVDGKDKDTETIPWKEDVEDYMQRNVYPYLPKAKIDPKKTKIGYEIPFTREFYKYVAPRKSEDIFAHLQELDHREQELMTKIMGRGI